MFKFAKKIEIFVIVVIIAVIGIIFAFKQKTVLAPTRSDDQSNLQQQAPASTTTIEYQGQDGKTAFDLLKATHTLETKHYSFGDMVVSIDGITPDAQHFWALYVNGSMSQVGASDYVTKSTDKIKWQLDKLESYNQ